MTTKQLAARVVKAADRTRETGQTSGMVRYQALRTDRVWAGLAVNQAFAFSGWHHHGDHESVIFVVTGEVRLECGPGGKTVLEAGPGDFIFVPPGEIHREGNPRVEPAEIVVVRAGEGEIVVNVAGPES
jgi:uncharacterized RmlC-like cupin family protein